MGDDVTCIVITLVWLPGENASSTLGRSTGCVVLYTDPLLSKLANERAGPLRPTPSRGLVGGTEAVSSPSLTLLMSMQVFLAGSPRIEPSLTVPGMVAFPKGRDCRLCCLFGHLCRPIKRDVQS